MWDLGGCRWDGGDGKELLGGGLTCRVRSESAWYVEGSYLVPVTRGGKRKERTLEM